MGTANNELLAKLHAAISGWTAEVGTAQEHVSQQIAGANSQLARLLSALHDRNGHVAELAKADAEIVHLKQALDSASVPPGTVTHYTPQATPPFERVREELDTTVDRLNGAVHGWTDEVTNTQQNLSEQFATANAQLRRLVELLEDAASDSPAGNDDLLAQAQHERDVLSAEVQALNIELETIRHDQESFAETNLNSEAQRDRRQRQEIEALHQALAERDAFVDECQELLQDSQRIEAGLNEEIGTLTRELDALRAAPLTHDQPESGGDTTTDQEALQSQVDALTEQHTGLENALAEAQGTIEALQAELAEKEVPDVAADAALADAQETIARLEKERDEALENCEALDGLRTQVSELTEIRDASAATLDELAALRETKAALASALQDAEETIERLQQASDVKDDAPVDTLPDESPSDDAIALSDARETMVRLEQERDEALAKVDELDALRSQVDELTEVRDNAAAALDELAALRETQVALELALTESQETIDRLQASPPDTEAETEGSPSAPDEGPTPEALAEAQEHIARLEHERDEALATIEGLAAQSETSAPEPTVSGPAISPESHEGLQGAIAALEEELALLKRREEDNVASARTLLQELETHRSFEAAQETSLSMARSEIDDLRIALDDKSAQLQTLEHEQQATLDAAREEAEMLRAALEEQVESQQQEEEKRASGQAQTSALNEEIDALRSQLSAREAEVQAATPALEEARGALDALQTEQATSALEFRESQETAENWIDDLEKQLAESKAALEELRKTHEDLEIRYDTFTGELETMRSAERERSNAVDEARAETAEAQERIAAAEATIAELQAALETKQREWDAQTATQSELEQLLSERQQAAESLESDLSRLQGELADTRNTLAEKETALSELAQQCQSLEQQVSEQTQHEQELELARDQLASTLAEISEKSATQEMNLTEALSTLESQQQALQERDAQIETFRRNVTDMTTQMSTLSEEEQEAKRQADQLKEALDTIQASDAQHVDELEQSRQLLEQMRTEHLQQQETANQLSQRGDELEALLKDAQRDEISTLATVEELQTQVHTLQEKEAAESLALEETRSQVSAHQETLQEREQRVAELKARLTEVLEEKEALHLRSAEQEAAIQATMAEVSQIVTERDELRDALEKTKEEKGRIYVGEAGAGLNADEAAMSREQRARQQEILLSELTQYDGNRSLGDILADAQVISREQLKNALDIQAKDPSQLLGTILIEQDITTDDAIAQAVACQLGKSVVNPMEVHIQPKAVAALNGDICTWHVCMPLRITADRLVVAMANPLDESAIYKLRDVSQREITPVVGAASQIMNAIEAHYGTF